jgi:hypothetical protein
MHVVMPFAKRRKGHANILWRQNKGVMRPMPFTKSIVERFISSRAVAVSIYGASEMNAMVPESEHWLSDFGLAVIFNGFSQAALTFAEIENYMRKIAGVVKGLFPLVRQ